ncbi:MAG: DUF397 domain-containing protein [Actinomycetota bacterium]|nr:DUF397 domain-containing protein [Actinomycetota bacterium]
MVTLDLSAVAWRRSTRSTDNANCVEVAFLGAAWRRSSRSTATANCVEVAAAGPAVGVRDSKDPEGPVLVLPGPAWAGFVTEIRSGQLG